ncbi:DUF6058 family natural product biosynthesis protein [Undibacterium sp. Ji49W]|uniref:DUF6058 family natural product biosynthesis protein n=1 Tax=Undibacterium sp. Ji49W TaxID=3413040 RepID=UPI003BF32DCD
MSVLDLYLKKHYLNKAQFAAACNCTEAALDALIQAQLLPAPSYVVTENARIFSAVFGEMDAVDTDAGEYFHPANTVWYNKAQAAIATHGDQAAQLFRQNFMQEFIDAITELNATLWHVQDSFTSDGTAISAGLQTRADFAWQHFLMGTFSLCVANPVSAAAIARKEILQEKLGALTDHGNKRIYSIAEAKDLLPLVDAYAQAAMWFSPAEYPRCSRKRLVDDLRPRLLAAIAAQSAV